MNGSEARFVFCRVWEGGRKPDGLFVEALSMLGIKRSDFNTLRTQARRAGGHVFPPNMLLAPIGSGKRR
jgi:hypothetical protein